MKDLITAKQAAERFNVSEKTVLRLLQQKELKGSKVGSQWRISTDGLNEYLERTKHDMTMVIAAKRYSTENSTLLGTFNVFRPGDARSGVYSEVEDAKIWKTLSDDAKKFFSGFGYAGRHFLYRTKKGNFFAHFRGNEHRKPYIIPVSESDARMLYDEPHRYWADFDIPFEEAFPDEVIEDA